MRIHGHHIGKKARLGFASVIQTKGKISLGYGASIVPFSYVKCNKLHMDSHSRIAAFVFINTPEINIGKDCQISNLTIIRSGHVSTDSSLVLGNLVHIFPFVTIDCSRRVFIDDETGIGPHCSVFTHGSYKSALQGYPVTYGNVNIGKRVELTYNVFVAPGVTIGDDAICAYGSYVNKDVPDGSLAAGLPASVKRSKEQLIVGSLDSRQIINRILEDYQENVRLTIGRNPLQTFVFVSEEGHVSENNAFYLFLDSAVQSCTAYKYGVFDITGKTCSNHGLPEADFSGFRKFLSRYGIRLITQ